MADSPHERSGKQGHSRKRQRLAVLASVSALLLLAGALLVARQDALQREAQRPQVRDPNTIRILRPSRAELVLQRAEASWHLIAPCYLAVNKQRLSPLLEALNTPGASYSSSDVNLEATGLLSPQATVILDDEIITIGGLDVSGERRYVQSGQRVELVPEWILSLVDGGMTAFADNAVFRAEVSSVVSTTADNLAQGVALWTELSASQTVEWPLDEALPFGSTITDFSVTLDSGKAHEVQVTSNDAWQAVVLDGEQCARLLAPDTLPLTASATEIDGN